MTSPLIANCTPSLGLPLMGLLVFDAEKASSAPVIVGLNREEESLFDSCQGLSCRLPEQATSFLCQTGTNMIRHRRENDTKQDWQESGVPLRNGNVRQDNRVREGPLSCAW